MTRIRWGWVLAVVFVEALSVNSPAQVRLVPAAAKGGRKPDNPADVPESFRHWKRPDWTMPTDLPKWESVDRARTRATLVRLMGDMLARPDPRKVELIAKEEREGYTLERFQFHNGVDMVVPGILMIPKGRKSPQDTGHEYLPEMKAETIAWFER